MRSFSRLLVPALLAGLLSALAAPPATAADTAFALPMNAFRDLAVDDAHGHVFLTGGGSNGVVVRDLDGGAVTVIADQPGATGLALSPDASLLYVALSNGDAISAIDTVTLTETARHATGATTCPTWVGALGDKLWFGYGCSGWQGSIGVVDLGQDPAAVTLARAPAPAFYSAPMVLTSAALPGRLLAAASGSSPTQLRALDIDGTTLTAAASVQINDPRDIAITADGTHVVIATGAPYYHPAYQTSDLSADGGYGANNPYPNAVATGSTGHVAAGINAAYADDVKVYTAGGTLVRSYDFGGCCNQGSATSLAPNGLAFAGDVSRLFAVTTDYLGSTVTLRVLRDATKALTTVTFTPPATPRIGTAFTVTGHLASVGAIVAGQTVHVTRVSSYGTVALPDVTTDASGNFQISDTVTQRGTYTYRASWDGDGDHAAAEGQTSFKVTGIVPALRIATNRSTYAYHATATVTAYLGTTATNRAVSLYAQPRGRSTRTPIKTGNVDSTGHLSGRYTLSWRTTFYAVFAGDATYEPRTVSRTVAVTAKLTEALTRYYATSGSYRLYHASVDPVIYARVAPNRAGTCMYFDVQRYYSGAWRAAVSSGCIPLESDSFAAAEFFVTPPVGSLFRMRARFAGDSYAGATTGGWLYLRFTS